MPNVEANGIRIEYDTFGDSSSPTLLMIMGLGGQLISWPTGLCDALAALGLYVIRFDNRDVGLSTKFEGAGTPDFGEIGAAVARGKPAAVPYTLEDIAEDAIGLMDAIGVVKAHLLGFSMGGMIAQILAYTYPERVLSLVSVSSSTGNPELPSGDPEALALLSAPAPEERDAYVEHWVDAWRSIASPGFPFDEDETRRREQSVYDRCYHPQGMARQQAAIMVGSDRRERLAAIRAPTMVIHGGSDPIVPIAAGEDTARSIPGAELHVIDGMGHDLPRGAWPSVIEGVSKVLSRS